MGKRVIAPVACLLLLLGLVLGFGWSGGQARAGGAEIKGEYVPGQVIVKFKAGVVESTRDRLLTTNRMAVSSQSRQLGFKVLELPDGTSVAEAVAALSADPAVEYVEPNYIDHIAWTPNDPQYPNQWNMHDFASGGMNAQTAWDTERGDSSVIVAVVDTGVAYEDYGTYTQAPDLAGTTFVPLRRGRPGRPS